MNVVPEKLFCRMCNRRTNHHMVTNEHGHEFKYVISHLDYDEVGIEFFEEYSIVQCRGCDTIAFLKKYGDEDMFHLIGPNYHSDREYFEEYTVYPEEPKKDTHEQLLQFNEKFEFDHLPDLISGIRNETINAYKHRMNLLCNTGIRMIIESICKVNGIDKKPKVRRGETVLDKDNNPVMVNLSLFEKIEELQKRNLIDEKQKNILNQIRDIGNETVHEIVRPKTRELLQYLNIIDFILYNIYELPNLNFAKKTSPK
nr:hypothetical protein NRS6116_04154 [Bacillus subtilis]